MSTEKDSREVAEEAVKNEKTAKKDEEFFKRILVSRFWSLDDEERLTLKIASFIGNFFWVELLEQLLGKSAIKSANQLVQRGFFKECYANFINGSRQLTFPNPAFAAWVRKQSPPENEASLHKQIGDWLLSNQHQLPSDMYPFLADHLVKAGEVDKAFEIWSLGYEEAYSHCETLNALEYLTKVINAISAMDEMEDQRAEYLVRRGDLLRHLGEHDSAAADYDLVIGMEVSLEFNQRALIGKGDLEYRRGNINQAMEIYRRALDMGGVFYPLGRARAWRKIAVVSMALGNNSQAATALSRCQEIITTLKTDPSVITESVKYYGTSGLLLYARGRLSDSLAEYEKGKDLVVNHNIPALDALILCSIYLVYSAKGELGKALELAEKSVEISDIAGMLGTLENNLIDLGNLLCALGQYGRALIEVKRAMELARSLGNKRTIADAFATVALIYHDSGDEDSAHKAAREAIKLYEALEDRHHSINMQLSKIRWLLEWGKLDEAVAIFERLPVLSQDEDPLHFSYHFTMGAVLMKKAEQEKDAESRLTIMETARQSLYRARWRASEQKSFTELLSIHIALTGLEVTCDALDAARRHLTIVEAMFKIMHESLPDARMKKSIQNTWRAKELVRLKKLTEEATTRHAKTIQVEEIIEGRA
jgi:tetratricopeptide (TPR) repeat protein